MKSTLVTAAVAAVLAAALGGCTTQYVENGNIRQGDTLRPGGPPVGAGAEPGGPATGAATRISDPNAPKESNGGTGAEPNVTQATPTPVQSH